MSPDTERKLQGMTDRLGRFFLTSNLNSIQSSTDKCLQKYFLSDIYSLEEVLFTSFISVSVQNKFVRLLCLLLTNIIFILIKIINKRDIYLGEHTN